LNGHPYLMICHDVPAKIREAQERAGKPKNSVREWMRYRIDHHLLPRTLRRADLVFCNSRYVGQSVIADMRVDSSKVRYAPCAPGNDFRRLSRKVRVEEVRLRLGAPEGYVLVFFTGDARENFKVVPEVVECLVNRGISAPLLVAGVTERFRGMVEAAVAGRSWRHKVKIIPFVGAGEEAALAEIYTSASVYLETSLHEGFGMQVVEAMACGTPVVCSNRGALPEVAGEAALMVDPEDAEKVAFALAQVLSQKNLREDLKNRGLARSTEFSWVDTARVVLGGLKETAEKRHEGPPPARLGRSLV
jgi:glycosyltransferase involved in cell wall biosynthesis